MSGRAPSATSTQHLTIGARSATRTSTSGTGRRRNLEPEADPTGSPEKERTVPTAAVVAEGTQSIGAGAAEAVTTFDP